MSLPAGHAPAGRADDPLRVEVTPRSLMAVVVTVAGVWLLWRLWAVLLVVAVALVLAGALSPVVDGLERRRLPRPLALTLVLLALVLAILGLAALVLPALAAQLAAFARGAPGAQRAVADALAGVPFLASQAAVVRGLTPDTVLAPERALALARATAEATVLGLTTAVLAFYILAERERVRGFAFALLPRRYHVRAARVLLDMETVVGGYVRGQALTSALIGGFVFLLLWLVGTPGALALAAFAAFADLIPFIGGVLALVPAVLATLPAGPGRALLVLVAIVAYQQVESHLVIPRVYGKTLRLPATAVTVALLAGGTLLGLVGALLALPIAAGVRVLIEDLRIELPGDQPGEATAHAQEERAEAVYADETRGAPAAAAAEVATSLAAALPGEAADGR